MAWIERHWERTTPVSVLLYPLSLLYAAAAGMRRAAIAPEKLPVPVIVIGNLSVGGTGKTPLTLWLAEFLREHGREAGIVCRGYGGSARGPQRVLPDTDPAISGDEAALLARRAGCEVWIGADRVATARALLAANPACSVILSDDGLQHYALGRDLEICVVDAARGFGNGCLLPAGPLREPPARLRTVGAVVLNGGGAPHFSTKLVPEATTRFGMRLEGSEFRNLLNPERSAGAEAFRGKNLHAIAGIGNPDRFFRMLQAMGLNFTAHPYPDHHAYTASDLAYGADAVLMTEKDAVKCRQFEDESHWELPVDAVPDPGLGELVLRKLESLRK